MEEQIVSAKDFRLNFTKYSNLASQGCNLVVIRRSKPIFRVLPIQNSNITQEEKKKDFLSYAGFLSEIDEQEWIGNIRKQRKLRTRKKISLS